MGAVLRQDAAEARIHGICFKTGPPQRTGVELEWLVRERSDPARAVSAARLDAALAPLEAAGGLPNGGSITREPGGQLELSSCPASSPAGCVEATAADLALLRETLARSGLVLDGRGLDAYRSPRRVLDHPRYRAMEAYFDRAGHWGRTMMRATASVQVSVDAGDEGDGVSGYRYRWRLAHRLGPVLVAAFANSPLYHGRPTGWASTRQAVWAHTDPGRTRPPHHGDDPRAAWARYALNAPLLCLRRPPPASWTAPPGLAFGAWLRGEGPADRPATLDDLDYHLGTLFPPVRPRGWLELRMIDAQPDDDWVVPTVLTATLLDDPEAAAAAYEATAPLAHDGHGGMPPWETWLRAARTGPADAELGEAVRACFAAARGALERGGAPAGLQRAVADFDDRYAARGRCPADDLLDAHNARGNHRTHDAHAPKGAPR